MELRILSASLQSRKNHDLIKRSLGGDYPASFSAIAKITAGLLDDYYARDPSAEACSREVLIDRSQKEAANPRLLKEIEDYLSRLDGSVSVPNLVFDIREFRRHTLGDRIAGLLANRPETSEIQPLIEQYQQLTRGDLEDVEAATEVFHEVGVSELLDRHFSPGCTIPFSSEKLTKLCAGGARPGHHALVFARPEIGKTLFTLDNVAFWLSRGQRVLYIGNEDPMPDITLRLYGRITSRSRDEIRRDPVGTQRILERLGYSSFMGVPQAPGTFGQIREYVDQFSPEVVVLDQLRNLDVGDDNRVTALEKAAIGARNLAKSTGTFVVSITQAGDSAEGRPHLSLSDIDFSKTGIPGAIDLAIGLGGTEEDKRFGYRQVSISKNKLGGEHGNFTVKFTSTGEVKDV